jgi:hypothetical protein
MFFILTCLQVAGAVKTVVAVDHRGTPAAGPAKGRSVRTEKVDLHLIWAQAAADENEEEAKRFFSSDQPSGLSADVSHRNTFA